MNLKVTIGETTYPVEIPENMLAGAENFFEKLNRDMDKGWQMSRRWVENPSPEQRCQIVADRVLTAIHQGNHAFVGLACAYILKYLPEVKAVYIDTEGDMTQTTFETG